MADLAPYGWIFGWIGGVLGKKERVVVLRPVPGGVETERVEPVVIHWRPAGRRVFVSYARALEYQDSRAQSPARSCGSAGRT